jgi:AmmeMemoRadiSam system protein A
MELSQEQRNTLLNIADWAIVNFLKEGERAFQREKFKPDTSACSKRGAFVSVYVGKELRGCMGTFSESEELCLNIHQMAIQAAFEDRRFPAIREADLEDMNTEISVLSPRKRIYGPDEIQIGIHGIYLIHEYRRATLLPQVALKNKWNAIEFLECCARNKLGLSKDSWKDAELYTYEALVFS